jgi:hypothetical protein
VPDKLPPQHWLSYGDAPLPDRHGPGRPATGVPVMVSPYGVRSLRPGALSERGPPDDRWSHGDRRIGDLIAKLVHEGCGGKAKYVELITGIPGSQHWPRKIVLLE